MSTRQRKVERKRKKRIEKNRRIQTRDLRFEQQAVSDASPLYACVVNKDWAKTGQASIYMARRTSSGQLITAAFLVDLFAMGLKDAWGRAGTTTEECQESIARLDEQLGSCKLDLLVAQHLVYGGIQLARELGFRLPRRHERWTAVLGPLPDGVAPDMSLFLDSGKIVLICSQRDLESRLIGTTPQKFLARPDVSYIIASGDFTLVDDAEDEFNDTLQSFEDAMFERSQRSCFANGEQPHPLLGEIVAASIEATLQSIPEDADLDNDVPFAESADQDKIMELTMAMLAPVFERDPTGFRIAITQFHRFIESCTGIDDMLAPLPLDD